MNSPNYFQVNTPTVIHEVIDGEAVLINLENGSYYSIDKVGAEIWSLIDRGVPVNQIIEVIAHQYDGSRGDIENGVRQLISELQQESLIVPDQERSSNNGNGPSVDLNSVATASGKLGFELPVLYKYTDMEDLLLLDPIHEVDETGWPQKAPDAIDENN